MATRRSPPVMLTVMSARSPRTALYIERSDRPTSAAACGTVRSSGRWRSSSGQ